MKNPPVLDRKPFVLTLSPMLSEFAGEFSNAHHMKLAHAMTSTKKVSAVLPEVVMHAVPAASAPNWFATPPE